MSRVIRDPRAEALQGGRAGFVSRVAADAVDLVVLQVLFFGCLTAVAVVRFLLHQGGGLEISAPPAWISIASEWSLLVVYLGTGWSSTGRTVGKTMLGLRVAELDGSTMRPLRAFARAVVCASFYPGLLWVILSRRNAAAHDLLLRSQVLYDWRAAATSRSVANPTGDSL